MMISQTAQFTGCTASRLCRAYLSSAEHAAMTVDGTMAATWYRDASGEVADGRQGDHLRAMGRPGADGAIEYSLSATILELIPDNVIVMSWRNKAFDLAVDPAEVSDLPSTVVLTFSDNIAGAEIHLDQAGVPNYKVRLPDTGEEGPLSQIINTHWSLLYWEPMRRYFASAAA